MLKHLFTLTFMVFLMAAGQAAAGEDPIYTGLFNNKAVGGYDVTSYYEKSGPVKGSKKFKTKWKGANWYFSSAENLAKFTANPEQYAPQYGGYCAWAAAHGTLAKGSPKHWDIVDGKLYLNYDKSIQGLWSPRKEELIPVADETFPELLED